MRYWLVTVEILDDNMHAFVMHTSNKNLVLIFFDTFQAYYVIPPKVGLVDIVMYCHGYVTCLLLLFHTPVANVNPGLSCVPVSI